jgi:curved DNA-binding protein CbpA
MAQVDGRSGFGTLLEQADLPLLRGARAAAALAECGILELADAAAARDAAGLAPGSASRSSGPEARRGGSVFPQGPLSSSGPAGPRGVLSPSASGSMVEHYDRMHALLTGADHYTTLGIEPSATAEQVRGAYYRLAKEIHPDRFLTSPLDVLHKKMEELFTQILNAYKELHDPAAREHYDRERLASGTGKKVTLSEQREMARQNFLRGRALLELGKKNEALQFLQNAVEMEPNHASYRRILADVLVQNPRVRREAEEHYLKAIELEPAHGGNYLRLSELYEKIGEEAKAIQSLQECLKWDSGNARASTALQRLRTRPGAAARK